MLDAQQIAAPGELLTKEAIRETLAQGLSGRFDGARVLVLIPDHTRTLPLPDLFRLLVEALGHSLQLDFMVALGTHPPLSEQALCKLVGISEEERQFVYGHIGLLNHSWDDPASLQDIGTIPQERVQKIAGDHWHSSLGGDVPVRINRRVFDYDQLIILGPTFPHEVVGFSGGAKYLFPGISGPELINVTHWLGALLTLRNVIGIKHTPVRAMIHDAAEMVQVPITLIALVVEREGLSGVFIGDYLEAWDAAATLSSARHIKWVEKPYQQVLSQAPAMYDELWVAGKAMYKLEPALAQGAELIIYAPHLKVVSHVHGKYLFRVGYHVRDYFLRQWDQFSEVPLGVLAHSTHVKGTGTYNDGVETAFATVKLASQISEDDCKRLNLGYVDPASIDVTAWQDREAEGVLYVPKAGETLYRLKPTP